MENTDKENTTKMENKDKRYYVDFYDMFDGWGSFGFFEDRLSDDLDFAIKLCDELNSEMSEGNKSCGEHFGVIDSQTDKEIYCGKEEYKQRRHEMTKDPLAIIKDKYNKNTLSVTGFVRGVYFSLGTTPATDDPKFDCTKAIIDLFDQAKISVHVAIYSLTEPNIVDAMIRANKRGVKVEIIADKIESKKASQADMIKKLLNAGVEIKLALHQQHLMHNKVAIFDNQTICTGSFNWSVNAEKYNDENLLVVDGSDLANDYEKYVFQRILQNETFIE